MLTFTAYSIIPKKIGKHILKRHQKVLPNLLFLIEGACPAKKINSKCCLKPFRELFICYYWFYRTAIVFFSQIARKAASCCVSHLRDKITIFFVPILLS